VPDNACSQSPLRAAREYIGLSREVVARRLEPPVASKTIERWEAPGYQVKRFRLQQFAAIYGVSMEELEGHDIGTARRVRP
jgi:DNA-binding transcriptional regulator YiaG